MSEASKPTKKLVKKFGPKGHEFGSLYVDSASVYHYITVRNRARHFMIKFSGWGVEETVIQELQSLGRPVRIVIIIKGEGELETDLDAYLGQPVRDYETPQRFVAEDDMKWTTGPEPPREPEACSCAICGDTTVEHKGDICEKCCDKMDEESTSDADFYPETNPAINAVDAYKRVDEINDRCDREEVLVEASKELDDGGELEADPDDDLTTDGIAEIRKRGEARRQAVIERDKDLPKIEIAPGFEVVAPDDDLLAHADELAMDIALDEAHAALDDTVLDLDHLPESGEARLALAVEMLKTTRQIVDELQGDFDLEAVKAYTDQLKSMLDDGVSLYNILAGKWALERRYAVGELVYFEYYDMTHIGKIKTIAKSELLIEFEYTPKNKKGAQKHVETWRRKDQVHKP